MHVDEVLCHLENGGATWETSHRGCIMRKVVRREVTDFFLDSEIFKTKNSLNPTFMKDIFAEKIALIACEITDECLLQRILV